jgi:hypothetical protein
LRGYGAFFFLDEDEWRGKNDKNIAGQAKTQEGNWHGGLFKQNKPRKS